LPLITSTGGCYVVAELGVLWATQSQAFDFIGERDGIRTHDLLIKSQMLYQLSYALLEERGWSSRIDATGQ
jgi:hypothetical protein